MPKSDLAQQDQEALKLKLEAEVGISTWEALAPHAERGALFWVDQSLDLVDVGVGLAIDDAASVQAWHQAELFLPAAPKMPEGFAVFRFLIIQPFVIASPLDISDLIDPNDLDSSSDDSSSDGSSSDENED